MSTLQVHITAGPQAGTRLQFTPATIVFGRSPDNPLVLDLPVVSRQHGELRYEEEAGQWVLVNLSSNTTRVGRKKAAKKPVPLTDGASITIGDTEVFRVYLPQVEEQAGATYLDDEDDEDQQPQGRAPGAGLKGRSKLWIGLGIYFAVMIALVVFFMLLRDDEEVQQSVGFWIPADQIDDDDIDKDLIDEYGVDSEMGPLRAQTVIRRLLREPPAAQPPNSVRHQRHLERAEDAVRSGRIGLYEAYSNFQIAISVAEDPDEPFENPQHDIDYINTIRDLAEIIHDEYMDAYRQYQRGNFADAQQRLYVLRQRFYPVSDPEDELATHINALRNAARRQSGR